MTVNTKKLPILPPGTGASIGGSIGSIIPGIGNAIGAEIGAVVQKVYNTIARIWNKIQSVKAIKRVLSGINCALQWFGYLATIKSGIEFLSNIGMSEEAIVEALGLNNLFKTNDIKKEINDSLASVAQTIKQANEIDRRSRLAPSGLNGVHRPGYHSIAISEIMYEFSNILGSGVMIIIFNPEGFGNKPRAPEIIRYVDEAELSEFLDADSWGNHWRVNYLLNRRKRRARTQPIEEVDSITGDVTMQPDSEPLDDYIERALDLPDFADDIIQDEFGDLIIEAFDRQEFLTGEFVKAIEKGGLGRGIEEKGLRITSAIQDKYKAVPNNVKRWTATNPIFKDVLGVTSAWKKQLTKMRGLRDTFSNARTIGTMNAEALAVSSTLGVLGQSQVAVGVASNFGAKIGQGGVLEATRTSYTTKKEFAATSDLFEKYNKKLAALVDPEFEGIEEQALESLVNSFNQEAGYLADNVIAGEAFGEWTFDFVSGGKRKVLLSNIGKGIFEGLAKPPTCIPFIKD